MRSFVQLAVLPSILSMASSHVFAQEPPRGIHARPDPADYAVKAVTAAIQKQHLPDREARTTHVYTEANVGYESGVDPVTGRRVHGTYEGAGVGVANGQTSDMGPQPQYPTPGGLPGDRELLQRELTERGLPTGKFDHPVAGYVYFSRSEMKKDANGTYPLEYLGNDSNGPSLATPLPVPVKSH